MSTISVSRHRLCCPRCGSFARVRNSVRLTETYLEGYVECVDLSCNSRWVIGIEFIRELESWRPQAPAPAESQLSIFDS